MEDIPEDFEKLSEWDEFWMLVIPLTLFIIITI